MQKLAGSRMPLSKILESEENIYELTNASIIRARQIAMAGSEDLSRFQGKVVTLAMNEIVTHKVKYRPR